MFIRSATRAHALAAVLSTALGLGVLAAPTVASAAESKFAVLDLRRALADNEDGMRMKAQLQELFDKRQADLETKEREFAKAKEELEKLAREGKISEADLRKRAAALEKQAYDLQNQGMVVRREMAQRENDMMAPILDKLNRLVRQIALQEGYDMVVTRDAVTYFRGDLEITDRVIHLYNQANTAPTDGKTPPKKESAPTAPKPTAPTAPATGASPDGSSRAPAAAPKPKTPTK